MHEGFRYLSTKIAIKQRHLSIFSYRYFVYSGFCLVLNSSNESNLSSNRSEYTPKIRRDSPSPQTTVIEAGAKIELLIGYRQLACSRLMTWLNVFTRCDRTLERPQKRSIQKGQCLRGTNYPAALCQGSNIFIEKTFRGLCLPLKGSLPPSTRDVFASKSIANKEKRRQASLRARTKHFIDQTMSLSITMCASSSLILYLSHNGL